MAKQSIFDREIKRFQLRMFSMGAHGGSARMWARQTAQHSLDMRQATGAGCRLGYHMGQIGDVSDEGHITELRGHEIERSANSLSAGAVRAIRVLRIPVIVATDLFEAGSRAERKFFPGQKFAKEFYRSFLSYGVVTDLSVDARWVGSQIPVIDLDLDAFQLAKDFLLEVERARVWGLSRSGQARELKLADLEHSSQYQGKRLKNREVLGIEGRRRVDSLRG